MKIEIEREKEQIKEKLKEQYNQIEQQKMKEKEKPKEIEREKENLYRTEFLRHHRKSVSEFPSKKVIDIYLDAKHLFEENKTTIATNARNYKNQKMGTFKL